MKKENCEYLTYLIIDKLELNLEIWGDWEASLAQSESKGNQEASLSWSEFEVTERLLYLDLKLGWLWDFSILIWILGDQEASLFWGDREASLYRFEPKAIERLLYLNLNLWWPRDFSILIRIWGDREASLSRSEPGVIERLFYLNLKLGWWLA